MFKRKSTSKSQAPAAAAESTALVATIASPEQAAASSAIVPASDEPRLKAENQSLKEENERLKGQIHLLKFKVDLLIDMVTIANLDCENLERELEGAVDKVEKTHGAPPPRTDEAKAQQARAAFLKIDKNKDGSLSRAEVITAVRAEPEIRSLLGLPAQIKQEDGTRDAFEQVFQAMDVDSSKKIDEQEFVAYFSKPR